MQLRDPQVICSANLDRGDGLEITLTGFAELLACNLRTGDRLPLGPKGYISAKILDVANDAFKT